MAPGLSTLFSRLEDLRQVAVGWIKAHPLDVLETYVALVLGLCLFVRMNRGKKAKLGSKDRGRVYYYGEITGGVRMKRRSKRRGYIKRKRRLKSSQEYSRGAKKGRGGEVG